jgi:very-short-patch-repair endonuclease
VEGDRALPLLADAQHSVAHCRQLNELGLDHSAITRRTGRGVLHRLHLGVYAIARRELTREGTLTAAVLAYRSPSLLAGQTALEAWGAITPGGSPTVIAPGARSRAGIRAITASNLRPADLCALNNLPLTAPARSLLDFAPGADPYELETALNELRAAKLLSINDLEELKTRTHGHHGWGPLNRLLAAEAEPGFSRKEAELRILRLIRAAALPRPQRNARIGRWEVDLLWPEARLVVEVDSYAFHSSRRAFERDRRKQTELQGLGFEVLRFTWRQITRQPEWVVAQIAARLAARALLPRPAEMGLLS